MSVPAKKLPPDGLMADEVLNNKQKQPKAYRISKRITEAIRLLITGECKTQKAAAERAGLNASHLSEQLRKPHIARHLEEQTRVALSRSQAPAAATLIRLATEASSEHVQKDAAIHLLNIAGHKPRADTQVSVNVEIKAGYVIDLSEGAARPLIDVSKQLTQD